jgi:hypothetical protein
MTLSRKQRRTRKIEIKVSPGVDEAFRAWPGLIHLHLWDIAYRHVGTLDVLFPVQVALCLLTAALLRPRRP